MPDARIYASRSAAFEALQKNDAKPGGNKNENEASSARELLARLALEESSRRGLKKGSLQKQASMPASQTSPALEGQSALEELIDCGSSHLIADDKTRQSFNRFTAETLKTASLFSRGRIGFASAILTHGLDQVRANESTADGALDFALGGLKGASMRGLFSLTSKNFEHAASKGMALGIGNRAADIAFNRQTLLDPSSALERLERETTNRNLWIYDGATFALGEGLFGGANKLSRGRLAKSELLGGMSMGGSFGIVNGGSQELIRQRQAGEDLQLSKVARSAGREAAVGMIGSAMGLKLSDPRFHASVKEGLSNLDGKAKSLLESSGIKRDRQQREFVVTQGQAAIDQFMSNKRSEATATVREIKPVLFMKRIGKEQTITLRHQTSTGAEESSAPVAKTGSRQNGAGDRPAPDVLESSMLLASCSPETLPAALRARHVFPDARGSVWLDMDSTGGRIRLLHGGDPQLRPDYAPLGKLIELGQRKITMNVMAPLVVGNPAEPGAPDPASRAAWQSFERDLASAKKLGIDGVSTDVWWGLVEPGADNYRWDYYDRLSDRILDHGLKWVPIISLHQAGWNEPGKGNVGDDVFVPVPFYIWNYLQSKTASSNPDVGKYMSEQGNASPEYVSAWATRFALPRYESLMRAFQDHFSGKREGIAEINVSLGPAGELRYPSYNSHDRGTGYPTRGGLQSYSELARKSFEDFVMAKYGSRERIKEAWGELDKIEPPRDVEAFFRDGKHINSQYGKDFFDWYNQSLIDHGKLVLGTALDVFGQNGSPFGGIDIGAKIPGIHWRVGSRSGHQVVLGDRLAELTSGIIRTSGGDWSADGLGRGYAPILSTFSSVQRRGAPSQVVPHFTALEMMDGQEGPAIQSLPYSLANWVGRESARQGLRLKGENALGGNLYDGAAWDRLRSHLALPGNREENANYHGLTLLRMSDALGSDVGRAKLAEIIRAIREASSSEERQAK